MKYLVGLSIIFIGVLVGVYLVSVSYEITVSDLDSKEDVQEWIERGWGPKWFPDDAYNMVESHDIDSNSVWVSATIRKESISGVAECASISRDALLLPRDVYLRRLPVIIQNRLKSILNGSTEVYFARCSDGFFVAVDDSGKALFWNLGNLFLTQDRH